MIKKSLALFCATLALSTFTRAQDAAADQVAEGKKNYMMICIACHQPTGLGLPAVFPPLTKSPYVNGSPERFASIILKGNAGPFTVDGTDAGERA